MIRKVSLILLSICTAVVLFSSCEKEPSAVTASFEGVWAWTDTYNGSSWSTKAVDEIYVFDGKGNYTIRKSAKAVDMVGGILQNTEDYFVADSKTYTCTITGGSTYHFSSMPDQTFSFSAKTNDSYTFLQNVGGKTMKFKMKKVSGFLSAEDVDPDDGKTRIAHTVIEDGNDIVGLVKHSETGKGIPGVAVSDGYTVVTTDANGVYQFKSNKSTRLVYYSTPSEYAVNTETSNPSIPLFYAAIKPNGSMIRTDFVLKPLPAKETDWTFVGIGDPQCSSSSNANRYTSETIADIKTTLSSYSNVYAATLGDITFDSTNMWDTMKKSMSSVQAGSKTIPFFQTLGNHDHDSLQGDSSDNILDDYNATSSYVGVFGPTDYSFNRGDVHIVVMDDIMVTAKKSSSKPNKQTWSYSGGFTDAQIKWLRADLSAVPDRANKMVFICCHIQFRNSTSNHYPDVLTMLEEFKEAHIMIGHTHYTQNYIYANSSGPFRKGKSGLPVYEHIHGSACGAWWTGSSSSTVTGEPSGYTIYSISGPHIKDWVFKGTRKDINHQLRVFDGNEIYYSTKTYSLNWYTTTQAMGSLGFSSRGNAATKGCFVAQVFNDDDTYWKVAMYNRATGAKVGDFTRIANGNCCNIASTAFYFNAKGKSSDSYNSKTVSHYWYFKPASGTPKDEKDWEVRATHTLPGRTATHTYTCTTLSTEQSFAKDFYF